MRIYSTAQEKRRKAGLKKRRMPINLVERIITEAAKNGLKEVIPSTMGEPLLYSHFEEIAKLCKENKVKLYLTTNATFPRKEEISAPITVL